MRTSQRVVIARANNVDELRQAMADVDTDVPLRTEGRTTEHTERYAIAHLLVSIPASRVQFPLAVDHGDRPDFFINEELGRRIAIEHVEAVPQNEAKRAALREEDDETGVHFISHAEPGERPRSTKRLLKEIRDKDGGDGWVGDSAEREWIEAVAYFGLEKAMSVQKEGYDRGDEMWLLMCDNWPLPHVDAKKAATHFTAHAATLEIFAVFRRLFVMDGEGVWEFTASSSAHHPLQRP